MTPTEDDLRGALHLLEQRAPDVRAQARPAPPRSRWGVALRIGSVAALVLVVAGGAALIGLQRNQTQPGPTTSTRAQVTPPAGALATLRVRVALFGGPLVNGPQPRAGRPQAGVSVVVKSVAGESGAYRSQLKITATTNRNGIAIFPVPPGVYRYRWDEFDGKRTVRLTAGEVARVQIDADVP